MEDVIKLKSRYKIENYLRRVGTSDSKDFYLDTKYAYRVGFVDENQSDSYQFVDPSGGPFISVGSEINGHKVKCIYTDNDSNNIIVRFE